MSTCQSCGGIIGRDCFNPEECAHITRQQEQFDRQNEGQEIQHLKKSLAQKEVENKQLRETIEKLPKTADGVTLVIGSEVWFWGLNSQDLRKDMFNGYEWHSYGVIVILNNDKEVYLGVKDCYSTKQAAQEAKEKG